MPDRPNILLIIADEHAPQVAGFMGAGFAITPNMDRLAGSGVTFDAAYTPFALCVPARNCLMAGLYGHRIRAYDNGSPLSSALPTWAHMCAAQGYRTVLDGKMHFVGPDTMHGFQEHWHEKTHRIGGFRWGEENPGSTAYRSWSEIHRIGSADEHDYARVEVDKTRDAVAFLDQAAASDRPFCLTVGYNYPHYPQVCTEQAWQRYEGVDIPPPVPRETLFERNRKWSDEVWRFDRVKPDEVAPARRAYCAMVSMLDDWIGQLLDALERTGLADNTVVICTADHGDMWGEHGLWGKNLFYEESSRIPMIISAPALGVGRNRRVPEPVNLVDLYPTMRDIVGAEWDIPLDGQSLWPACTGRGGLDADRPVFCDYYGSDTVGPERMIRWRHWKLNYYHRQGVELFDLAADPHEQHDLSTDPVHADTIDRLMKLLTADWDVEAIDADIRIDQSRRALLGRG